MKLENKIRRLFFKNLNALYNTANSIAKKWNKKSIPLNLLEELIEKAKFNKPVTNNNIRVEKAITDIENSDHKVMNSLYKACEAAAKSMNSKEVPLTILKHGIDIIKKNFTIGMKDEK